MDHIPSLRTITERIATREWLQVAALIAIIKLAWLLADHTLRIYMGDSMVFLQTGAWLSGSPGRSWLYGALLHYTAFPFKSPVAIVALQTAMSLLSALGLFYFIRSFLGLRFWPSTLAAVAFATEPAQVFFERMVMAETAGTWALVATVIALACYLRQGKLRWYLLSCLIGLVAANFRTNLLPVVLGLGGTVPLIRFWLPGKEAKWLPRAKPLAIAFAMLIGSHVAYTHAYGYALNCPPGYLALTGMMRIGLVAPLVHPEHFEGTGVSGDILKKVTLPLDDHWNRSGQIWTRGGLWQTLEANTSNPEQVARVITRRAMQDDPLGLLAINIETLGAYFDSKKTRARMKDDIGSYPPDEPALRVIREWLDWDARGVNKLETPARTYFAGSGAWLTFCLFALVPIALMALYLGWQRPQRSQYLLLALTSAGLIASHLLFSHIASFRYLHALPWFLLAGLAVVLDASINRLGRSTRPASNADTPRL